MEIKYLCVFRVFFAVLVVSFFMAVHWNPLVSGEEDAGNNLSYPVFWAESVTKTLPGTSGMTPVLTGEWCYQWGSSGVDPNVTPASCPPDPDESNSELNPENDCYCDDGIQESLTKPAGIPVPDNPLELCRAYVQKDSGNIWQAQSADSKDTPVWVDLVDWGDNLESVDWYTRSQVRVEVVLFEDFYEGDSELVSGGDVIWPMDEYEMRHSSGWGIDEVHGLAVSVLDGKAVLAEGNRATVFSNCARLTIQKLLVDRDDARLADLVWIPEEGWTEPEGYGGELINGPIFNGAVYEGGDGPGFYSAEINVKGRIIYGYTWSLRNDFDDTPVPPSEEKTAAGDYRITFSFDLECGKTPEVYLNAFFGEGTQIIVPLEEEIIAAAESEDSGATGGGTGVMVPAVFDENGVLVDGNLTYIDVRILERDNGRHGHGHQ